MELPTPKELEDSKAKKSLFVPSSKPTSVDMPSEDLKTRRVIPKGPSTLGRAPGKAGRRRKTKKSKKSRKH